MTSMPVTNMANSYMTVTTGGAETANKSDGFSSIYDSAKNKVQTDEKITAEKPNSLADRKKATERDRQTIEKEDKISPVETEDVKDAAQMNEKAEDTTVDTTEDIPEEKLEEMMTLMNQTVSQVLEMFATELETDVAAIEEVLVDLNMNPEDILKTENVTAIVMETVGENDPMALATDENLYEMVQNLMEAVDTIASDLEDEIGYAVETLQNMISDRAEAGDNSLIAQAEVPKQTDDANEVPQTTNDETGFLQEVDAQPTETSMNQNAEGKSEDGHSEDRQSMRDDLNNPFMNLQNTAGNTGVDAVFTETLVHNNDMTDGIDIIRQLTNYMHTQQKEDLTQMELQLHPATLGTINMTISSREGVVTANIQTQNEAVKNVLESQVMMLRQNLEDQGVKVEAIEVTIASHEFERNLDQSNEQERQEFDNAQKTSGKRRTLRQINLNEEADAESIDEDDEIRIAREMMMANGNTVDYTV